jgi:hypothetical protein
MKTKLFLLLCGCLIALSSFAQQGTLKGKVYDAQRQPLPFANVYIENTTQGTTANLEGAYDFALPYGEYQIVFQYVGHQKQVRKVVIDRAEVFLEVILPDETLSLQEVVIKAGENPALEIIRKAQKQRKKYRNELIAYQCEVYLKGLNRLRSRPKQVMGIKVSGDTGVIYFSESVSELSFQQPNKIKEKVIASKVSGNSNGFSFNRASVVQMNFYDNLVGTEFAERGLVSPIAGNAFAFYDYELMGAYKEDGLLINKIRVIPRRSKDPVFYGYIYIVEDSWRIHSTDLHITADNQVEFIDSLKIQQVYRPADAATGQVWVMLSQRFDFTFSAFGFKGEGYFLGVYSRYQLEPAFGKKYFSNEILSIDEEANKKDSSYWQRIRPMPLTASELKDYRQKDSLEVVRESRAYQDSTDRQSNRLSLGNVLYGGFGYRNSYRNYSLRFVPLIGMFQYNTVEGTVVNFSGTFFKRYKDLRAFSITPTVRYGFASEQLYAKLRIGANLKPKRSEGFSLEGGSFIEQINRNEPIVPLVNALYTLLDEQNFMKLFRRDYIEMRYQRELFNGLRLTGVVEYAQRYSLQNKSDFRWRDVPEREFTPNAPSNIELADTDFGSSNALKMALSLNIRFAEKYISRPNQKFVIESKYPGLNITYFRGLPLGSSQVDYDRLEVRSDYDLPLGLWGESNFEISAGQFFNTRRLTFLEFKHFEGNQTLWARGDLANFQLLDYYFFSTTRPYATAHWQHHFNGALFSRIPLLQKLKWQEVLTCNYLYQDLAGHYVEAGIGIEHIFKLMRVDFYWAFLQSENYARGLRIGFGF